MYIAQDKVPLTRLIVHFCFSHVTCAKKQLGTRGRFLVLTLCEWMLYRAYVASEEIPRTCDFAALEFGASGCKYAILPNKPGGNFRWIFQWCHIKGGWSVSETVSLCYHYDILVWAIGRENVPVADFSKFQNKQKPEVRLQTPDKMASSEILENWLHGQFSFNGSNIIFTSNGLCAGYCRRWCSWWFAIAAACVLPVLSQR